jgi:hypothetical protein
METDRDFWFGALNGMHVVYDASIQLPGSHWLLLFQVRLKRLIAYHKPHARSVLVPVTDREKAAGTFSAYREWRYLRYEVEVAGRPLACHG